MTRHDPRLHVWRPDLADSRLQGTVSAERFVEARAGRIVAAVADLRSAPRSDAGMATQLLAGTPVSVFEEAEGFAWVQSGRDSYVGYVASADLGPADRAPTHRVIAPRTFLYAGPDLKLSRTGSLSMGSEIEVVGYAETRGLRYAMLPSGEAMVAAHLAEISVLAEDFVAVAETLVNTPYLWGGTSAFGIDCSGLVQLSMRMAGRDVLRDADLQAGSIGEVIEPDGGYAGLQRGDLVFWKGHVAIMTDPGTMIHANGHTMLVSREDLRAGIDRIGYLYGAPTLFRRP